MHDRYEPSSPQQQSDAVLADVLMQHAGAAVCIYDAQDRIQRWNARYLDFFPEIRDSVRAGLPFVDTVRAFFAIQHPHATPVEHAAAIESAMYRHRHEQGPIQYQRADTGRWLELRMFPQPEGGRIKVWTDVTAERAPGTDGSQLIGLMTVVNVGLTLHSAAGALLYVNSRFFSENFLGLLTSIPAIETRHARGSYWQRFHEIFAPSPVYQALCADPDPGPLQAPAILRTRNDRFFRIQEQAWEGGIASIWSNVTELVERENALEAAHAELMVLNRRLREVSEHDDLTGLPNRRRFNAAVAQAQALAEREGACCCVGLLDLDHFKTVNDRFGHDAGDDVLVETGRRIASRLAPGDMLARLGGEEFGLLLHNATLQQAAATADRLRAALADQPFLFDGAPVGLSGSIGLAALTASRPPADSLREADRALYVAKRAGRNRVEPRFRNAG